MSGSQAKYGFLLDASQEAQKELDAYVLPRLRSSAEQVRSILWKKQVEPPPGLEWTRVKEPWILISVSSDVITLLEVRDRGHGGEARVQYHHIEREWLYLSVWEVSKRVRVLLDNSESSRARKVLKRKEAEAQRHRLKLQKMESQLHRERSAYRAVTLELEKFKEQVTTQ